MRKTLAIAFILLLAFIISDALVSAQRRSSGPPRRARLPKFNASTAPKPFFKDLFKEALEGERPANLGRAPQTVGVVPGGGNPGSGDPSGGTGGFAWSKVISSATIENEIKSLKISIDKNVTTPSDFAGRGHKIARRDFTMTATMFAIAGEFDQQVRWKKEAPTIRDVFARAAANTKAGGNIQVYKEAKLRKADLQDLVGGGSFTTAKQNDRAAVWEKICHRSPLMQRLEIAQQKNMDPWIASDKAFQENKEQLMHEAEIVAALAEILTRDGMEDGGDEDYKAFCKSMRDAARNIVDAVRGDDYQKARNAMGQINKACSQCHENYRG